MSKNSKIELTLERILVAVDNSKRSAAALEAAAIFARLTKAKVEGLYVQEEHWHPLDNRSRTFLIDELTGQAHSLKEHRLKHEAELIAGRLKKQLQEISRRHEVGHRWKCIRGKAIEKILEASKEVDLITIGRRSNAMLHQKKLGSTTKAIIEGAHKPILILAGELKLNRTIVVVYDRSKEGKKSLKMGLLLAQKNKSRLFVLILNNRDKKGNERNKEVEQLVDSASVPVNIASLNQATIGNVIHIVKKRYPGLIFISKNQPLLKNDSLEIMLHYLNCTILLMN